MDYEAALLRLLAERQQLLDNTRAELQDVQARLAALEELASQETADGS